MADFATKALVSFMGGMLILAVFGGVALKILDSLGLTGDSALFVGNVTEAMGTIGENLGLLALVVIFGVIILVVMAYFGGMIGFGKKE
jgi:hypothetical protein